MKKFYLIAIAAGLISACAPKLYVIDKQTILQSEATGEFPNLERSLADRASQFEPKMADRTQLKQKQTTSKSLNVLNGEMTSEESTAQK